MRSTPLKITALVVGGLLLLGAAFYAGTVYQHGKVAAISQTGTGLPGARRFGGMRPTQGQVSSVSGSTLVVKSSTGSDITVTLSSNTSIIDSSGNQAAITDIQVGSNVAVFGTTNTDGNITARRIRLNPGTGSNSNPSGSAATNGT